MSGTALTPAAYAQKWGTRFPDQNFENVTPADFREQAADTAASFLSTLAPPVNVPAYSPTFNINGTPPGYRVDFVVRHTLGGYEGFYAANVDGQLPAPTSPVNDANWRRVAAPASPVALYQVMPHAAAVNYDSDDALTRGREYLITERPGGGPDVRGTFSHFAPASMEFAALEGQAGPVAYDLATDADTPISDGTLKARVFTLEQALKVADPTNAHSGVQVGGFLNNVVGLESAAVGGGGNSITGNDSGTVGGFQLLVSGQGSGSVGGGFSHVTGNFSGQLGGYNNFGRASYAAILGGFGLTLPVGANYSAIVGGGGFVAPALPNRLFTPQVHLFEPGGGMSFLSPDGQTRRTLSIDNAGNPVWSGISAVPLAPTLTGASPNNAAPGDTVTLTGTNLASATALTLNGVSIFASIISNTATAITFTLPAGATSGVIAVTTAGGTVTSTGSFTVNAGSTNALMFISGQSNALGVGEQTFLTSAPINTLNPAPTREFQRAFIWNKEAGAFQKLQVGINNRGFTDHYGAEIGLAQRWEADHATGNLYLIKHSIDGNPIESWAAGSTGYLDLLNNYALAGKAWLVGQSIAYTEKGIYWMQGESNAGDTTYKTKLQSLKSRLIADGAIASTSLWVIGKVRSNAVVADQDVQFVAAEPNARLIDTAYYDMNPDDLHYNGLAQFLCGYTDVFNRMFNVTGNYPVPMDGSTTPAGSGNISITPPDPAVEVEEDSAYWTKDAGTYYLAPNTPDHLGKAQWTEGRDSVRQLVFNGTRAVGWTASYGFLMEYEVWLGLQGQPLALVASVSHTQTGGGGLEERWNTGLLPSDTYVLQIRGYAANPNAHAWCDLVKLTGAPQTAIALVP